jgi:hypothetical protein
VLFQRMPCLFDSEFSKFGKTEKVETHNVEQTSSNVEQRRAHVEQTSSNVEQRRAQVSSNVEQRRATSSAREKTKETPTLKIYAWRQANLTYCDAKHSKAALCTRNRTIHDRIAENTLNIVRLQRIACKMLVICTSSARSVHKVTNMAFTQQFRSRLFL